MGQWSVSSRFSGLALETLQKSVIKRSVGCVIGEDTTRFYDSVSPWVGGRKEFQLHLKDKNSLPGGQECTKNFMVKRNSMCAE